ncbi:hypothetical protein [Nitrobacter hamburgensis]|nr:hypothetical protein [Nitrobacter hamburgensis]
MHYTLIYDVVRDGRVGLVFPSLGVALLVVGIGMRMLWPRSMLFSIFLILVGLFTLVAAGALPWWDDHRAKAAVHRGEAKMVEGPVNDWRLTRSRQARSKGSKVHYNYFEHFTVGGVAFHLTWGNLEAGFNNQGSDDGKQHTRIADGDNVRIWYLPPDKLISTPRIVRFETAAAP